MRIKWLMFLGLMCCGQPAAAQTLYDAQNLYECFGKLSVVENVIGAPKTAPDYPDSSQTEFEPPWYYEINIRRCYHMLRGYQETFVNRMNPKPIVQTVIITYCCDKKRRKCKVC